MPSSGNHTVILYPFILSDDPLNHSFIYTSIHPLTYITIHLTIHPSVHLLFLPCSHLSAYSCIYPLSHLSTYPSIYPSFLPSICLSIHLCNQPPTHPRFIFSCPDSLCTHASLTGRLPTDHHSVSGTLLRTDDTLFSTDKNSCPHGAHPTPLTFLPSNYPTSYPSISPLLCTGLGLRIFEMNQTQARYLRSHDLVKIDR